MAEAPLYGTWVKVKPPSAGGLDVSGESETAFETSAGEDKDSQLDLNKLHTEWYDWAMKGGAKPEF